MVSTQPSISVAAIMWESAPQAAEMQTKKKPLINKRPSMERLTTTILKMKEFHHLATEQEEEEKEEAKEEEEEGKGKGENEREERTTKKKKESDAMGLDQLEVLMKSDRR